MDHDPEKEKRRARWISSIMVSVSMLGIFAIYTYMVMEIADGRNEIEALKKACPNPVVEMAEYRGVVHALEACGRRLDEEQQNVLDMRAELDHWDFVEWEVRSGGPDAEIDCQVLLARSLRRVWFDDEDALIACWQVQRDECWCPFEMEAP